MCRGGPGRLRGYGDLRLHARAGGRDLCVGSMGATDEAFAVRALAPSAAGSLAAKTARRRTAGQSHPTSAVNDEQPIER